jgi:hypothetical protein
MAGVGSECDFVLSSMKTDLWIRRWLAWPNLAEAGAGAGGSRRCPAQPQYRHPAP